MPGVAGASLAVALAERGITTGRLLRSVNRHGRPGERMSADAVADVVRERARAAGLPDAEHYSAHSLRAGDATSAYKAGAPVSVIAAHGGGPRARPWCSVMCAPQTGGGTTR